MRHDIVRKLDRLHVGGRVLEQRLAHAKLYGLCVRVGQLRVGCASRVRGVHANGSERHRVQRGLLLQQQLCGSQQQDQLRVVRGQLRDAVVRADRGDEPVLVHVCEQCVLPGGGIRGDRDVLRRKRADAMQLPVSERDIVRRAMRRRGDLLGHAWAQLLPLLRATASQICVCTNSTCVG